MKRHIWVFNDELYVLYEWQILWSRQSHQISRILFCTWKKKSLLIQGLFARYDIKTESTPRSTSPHPRSRIWDDPTEVLAHFNDASQKLHIFYEWAQESSNSIKRLTWVSGCHYERGTCRFFCTFNNCPECRLSLFTFPCRNVFFSPRSIKCVSAHIKKYSSVLFPCIDIVSEGILVLYTSKTVVSASLERISSLNVDDGVMEWKKWRILSEKQRVLLTMSFFLHHDPSHSVHITRTEVNDWILDALPLFLIRRIRHSQCDL